MMRTTLHLPRRLEEGVLSGDVVLAIIPGRHILDLGRAYVTFDSRERQVVSVDTLIGGAYTQVTILRTSNVKAKDVPTVDLVLAGVSSHDEVLDFILDGWGFRPGPKDEVTVVRFERK